MAVELFIALGKRIERSRSRCQTKAPHKSPPLRLTSKMGATASSPVSTTWTPISTSRSTENALKKRFPKWQSPKANAAPVAARFGLRTASSRLSATPRKSSSSKKTWASKIRSARKGRASAGARSTPGSERTMTRARTAGSPAIPPAIRGRATGRDRPRPRSTSRHDSERCRPSTRKRAARARSAGTISATSSE